MDENKKAQAENLKRDEDVRRALEQTAGNKPAKKTVVETKHKFWFGTYLLLLVGFGVFYYLLRLGYFDFAVRYIPPLERLTLGAMGVVLKVKETMAPFAPSRRRAGWGNDYSVNSSIASTRFG